MSTQPIGNIWKIRINEEIKMKKKKQRRKAGKQQKKKEDKRNVSIIRDANGNKIVMINDIVFSGRQSIKWNDVKEYLCKYVGEFYRIASTKEIVYIGNDFPNEFARSEYSSSLRGTGAKAKANAAQGVPELIKTATGKSFIHNKKTKHQKDAKFGWYRYESRFALPAIGDDGEVLRYNVFRVAMLIRHSEDGKKYLYDILEIKKETGTPLQP